MRTIPVFRAAAAAFSVSALSALSLLTGCFGSGDGEGDVSFDRPALLANVADRLIIPAYGRLAEETRALDSAVAALVAAPDSARTEDARAALKRSWLAWQAASAFEIGPAAVDLLRQSLNTFPADSARIKTNLENGTWNLGSVSNFVAKGFPALDWLLHGRGADAGPVLAALADTARGAAFGKYLRDLSGEIAAKSAKVEAAWDPDGGDYRATFISRQGTDIGSSLGELVNQFNFDFEILKNPKLGIPLGKGALLGHAFPGKVEAYHAGYSLELMRAQLDALEDLFRGRDSAGTEGLGFDDYLDALGTRYGDGELDQAIQDRFAAIRTALEAVPDPLSRSITAETAKADAAYNEIQRMVPLIKSDMPSALSVSITYQDGDGD